MVVVLVAFLFAFAWYFLKTDSKSKTFRISLVFLAVAFLLQILLEMGANPVDFVIKFFG